MIAITAAGSANGDSLFYAVNQFTTVQKLNGDTGLVVDSFPIPFGAGSAASIAVVGNTGYYTLLGDANVYTVDMTTHAYLGIAFNTGDSCDMNGITVDSAQHLWFAHGSSCALQEFDTAGTLLSTHAFPDPAFAYRDGSVVYGGFVVANRGDQQGPYDKYTIPAGNAPLVYVPPSPGTPFLDDPTQDFGNNGVAFNGVNFYVSNEQLHYVAKYDVNGVYISQAPLDPGSRYENWTFASQEIVPPCGGIANGSFENDSFGCVVFDVQTLPVTGWTFIVPPGESPHPEARGNGCGPGPTPYGKQWVVLGGFGLGGVAIQQVVSGLIPGATYNLNFAISSENAGAGANVQVSATGSPSVNYTAPPATTFQGWDVWGSFSYSFVASASSVTISFLDMGSTSLNDIGLDNVCLAQAPPPPCDPKINVNVFSGSSGTGGGAPYSGYAGSLAATSVSFATDTGYDWHPFGLGEFGAEISGCLDVASDGTYHICLDSDDGSLLFIDGVQVVNNGGDHAPTVVCADVALTAGKHCFKIQFFECCGGESGVNLILPAGVALGCECPDPIVNVVKFYDANANGINDDGQPINGWVVTVDGTPYTTPANVTVTPGQHVTAEATPSQHNWLPTTATSFTDVLGYCDTVTHEFGNLCLGAGGGLTLGFWSNKNGQALETQANFAALNAYCLVNKNGTPHDFTGSLSQNKKDLNTWILDANAKNMAYMLSAQLTAMKLNVLNGKVVGTRLVYAPGCGNTGVGNNFITINDLMAKANAELCAHPVTLAGDPNRALQECLKNALDAANNNKNFVQLTPCSFSFGL